MGNDQNTIDTSSRETRKGGGLKVVEVGRCGAGGAGVVVVVGGGGLIACSAGEGSSSGDGGGLLVRRV